MDLADDIPAYARADKTLAVLHFLVESPGGLVISMSAEEHGNARESAADVADGVAGIAEAKGVGLPLRVLLGVVDEFECHE